jgi:hypothetical protein
MKNKMAIAWLIITILVAGMMPSAIFAENFNAANAIFNLAEWFAANPNGLPPWIVSSGDSTVARVGNEIHVTNRTEFWHGIDLLNSVIDFREGDTVTVTGRTLDNGANPSGWGAVIQNIQPNGWQERAQSNNVATAGNFISSNKITEDDLAVIRSANPSGIRVQTNGLAEVRMVITNIIITRESGGKKTYFELPITAAHAASGNNQMTWATEGFWDISQIVHGFTTELLRNSTQTLVLELSEPIPVNWGQGIGIGYAGNDNNPFSPEGGLHNFPNWVGQTNLRVDLTENPKFISALENGGALTLIVYAWSVGASGNDGSITTPLNEIINRAYIILEEENDVPADGAIWQMSKWISENFGVGDDPDWAGGGFIRNSGSTLRVAANYEIHTDIGGFEWGAGIDLAVDAFPVKLEFGDRIQITVRADGMPLMPNGSPFRISGTNDTGEILFAPPAWLTSANQIHTFDFTVNHSFLTEEGIRIGGSWAVTQQNINFYLVDIVVMRDANAPVFKPVWRITDWISQNFSAGDDPTMGAGFGFIHDMGAASVLRIAAENSIHVDIGTINWGTGIHFNTDNFPIKLESGDRIQMTVRADGMPLPSLFRAAASAPIETAFFTAENQEHVFDFIADDAILAADGIDIRGVWSDPNQNINFYLVDLVLLRKGEVSGNFVYPLGAPEPFGINGDEIHWSVTGESTQKLSAAKYFVFVADYAAMRAADEHILSGVGFIHNPQVGGWNQTLLNNDYWFGWWNIVHNGETVMTGQNGIETRIIHAGAENAGTLTFVIPVAQLVGQPFAAENANLVLAAWESPATINAVQRAYLASDWTPRPTAVTTMILPLGAPESMGNYTDRVQWSVTNENVQKMLDAKYFVMVADYAAMRAVNGDGMAGAALVRNSHTDSTDNGWNQTMLNEGWFSWFDNIVHNGETTMTGENFDTRVIHQGPANAGTLTFVIPMENLNGQSFPAEDASLVFVMWFSEMPNAVQRAYLASHWQFPPARIGDVDGDGRITSADATLIARWLIHRNFPLDLRAADVNCDGVVDFEDVTHLMLALVGYFPEGLCPHGGCDRCR